MASLEQRPRGDGGITARVIWRQDGQRTAEKFAVGRNPLLAAKRFKTLVEEAGNRWPEGWVPGQGFVTVETPSDSGHEPTPLLAFGLRYVEQLIIRPGQRARYRSQLKALAVLTLPSPTVPGAIYLPFGRNVEDVTPEDVRLWLSRWDRGLKTKANYHGLLFGVFAWAVEEHALIPVNPCAKTAPSRPTIKAEQPERTWLTEAEFKTFTDTFMAENSRDLLRVMVGTGLRFGEITALWVEDIDLTKRTLSVRKAWNRQGEDGETQIPKWLTKRISAKHEMRGHYLGLPKTPKSRRTITIAPSVVTILRRAMTGKSPDDFVFTTAARSTSSASLRWTGGRPIHAGDFSDQRWLPALKAAEAGGFAKRFTPHDLRHTHVAWLIAAGVPLPNIQQRLGHESITTTIDTYGHLLPQGNDLIDAALDAGLGGGKITISA